MSKKEMQVYPDVRTVCNDAPAERKGRFCCGKGSPYGNSFVAGAEGDGRCEKAGEEKL